MAPRLLLVHAHPDDEAIPTGVTMAKYAREGAQITLVTCTLGEEGEILAPDLAHLAAGETDKLGEHRMTELREACEVLGVSDVRLLGGLGRWRDSGMMDTPTNDNPASFWRADLGEAAAALVDVLREVRPHVVVTYDENGDYGHPDHIQANRVTLRALDDVAGEAWAPRKLYYTAFPKSLLAKAIEWFKETDSPGFFEGVDTVDELPFGTPDELVTTAVAAPELTATKLEALRRHRSQVEERGPFFALPDEHAPAFWGTEFFRLVRGELGPRAEGAYETDLFAGIDPE